MKAAATNTAERYTRNETGLTHEEYVKMFGN